MSGDAGTCRSCGAAILWALTANGKPTPLDAKPVKVAVTFLNAEGKLEIARAETGHVSHFASCPFAAQHRKPKEREA